MDIDYLVVLVVLFVLVVLVIHLYLVVLVPHRYLVGLVLLDCMVVLGYSLYCLVC